MKKRVYSAQPKIRIHAARMLRGVTVETRESIRIGLRLSPNAQSRNCLWNVRLPLFHSMSVSLQGESMLFPSFSPGGQ
jgi:hypothetical protein